MTSLSRRMLAMMLFLAAALPAQNAAKPAATAKTPATTETAPAKAAPAKPIADADKLDLNTATADQLKSLKGIGDAYSKRIIDGRPYTAKNQLTSRGILPAATYEVIKDQIIARAPKKK